MGWGRGAGPNRPSSPRRQGRVRDNTSDLIGNQGHFKVSGFAKRLSTRESAGAGDFALANGADLGGVEGDNADGFAGEGAELDFVALATFVDIDDGADVAGFETMFGKVFGQGDVGVFGNGVWRAHGFIFYQALSGSGAG